MKNLLLINLVPFNEFKGSVFFTPLQLFHSKIFKSSHIFDLNQHIVCAHNVCYGEKPLSRTNHNHV